MNLRDRNHQTFSCVHIATYYSLDSLRYGTSRQNWVNSAMWHSPMTTAPFDIDIKHIGTSHQRTRCCKKTSCWKFRHIVDPVNLGNVKGIQDTLFDHRLRATRCFLIRLEDQRNTARKVTRLAQVFCRSQ